MIISLFENKMMTCYNFFRKEPVLGTINHMREETEAGDIFSVYST